MGKLMPFRQVTQPLVSSSGMQALILQSSVARALRLPEFDSQSYHLLNAYLGKLLENSLIFKHQK